MVQPGSPSTDGTARDIEYRAPPALLPLSLWMRYSVRGSCPRGAGDHVVQRWPLTARHVADM
ncbi:hypothetical protein GDO81_002520 [Engystomops pustulosus]|uniref:Uncharacterized protein n=1 Tax=Engystomops pustulosus TaxID=76066 RepID=A0AAV7DMJ3_ENGPU|nr:hypothetical protein GDO81_002520 [Engystomops pustulosus]